MKDEKRKFYTIQDARAWHMALEIGFLCANEKFIWENFIEPYKWMMGQMKKRIQNYNYGYPIWMWPKRPDLRKHIYNGIPGCKNVLLEITLELDNVLGSDFDAWHFVLNNWKLGRDDEHISLESSWERIFDYDFLKEFDGREIDEQFVTGKIPIQKIRVVKEFEIRKKRHCT